MSHHLGDSVPLFPAYSSGILHYAWNTAFSNNFIIPLSYGLNSADVKSHWKLIIMTCILQIPLLKSETQCALCRNRTVQSSPIGFHFLAHQHWQIILPSVLITLGKLYVLSNTQISEPRHNSCRSLRPTERRMRKA